MCSYSVRRSQWVKAQAPSPTHTPPHRLCECKHTYTLHRRVWLTASGSRLCVKTRAARQRSSTTESDACFVAGPPTRSHRKPSYFLSLFFPSLSFQLYLCEQSWRKGITPPSSSLSLSLSLSLFLSVLWWDKQWKDEPVIQHQTWVTWQLKLWVHESLSFTSTPAHTHVYMQTYKLFHFYIWIKTGVFSAAAF